ncbi:MAG: putative oxidoreductase [Janthinobacterium sp.]|jgi:predicted oxidoreductase
MTHALPHDATSTSTSHIIASLENSLCQLRTDLLDLRLIHRPGPLMDLDEIAPVLPASDQPGRIFTAAPGAAV